MRLQEQGPSSEKYIFTTVLLFFSDLIESTYTMMEISILKSYKAQFRAFLDI